MKNESFSVLHFNDVYDLQPEQKEPKAGAAYFKALLDRYRKPNTLTLFSGDVFSPSLLSTEHKGQNMIKPLNSFKIDIACLGNHDLDYDIETLLSLKKQTNFPWLLSNIFDKRTKNRLAESEQYRIIEKGGIRIGIFSLAQKEWIDTLMPEYFDICEYYPFVQFAEYMIKFLKGEKCDMIIALTHMMKYNDIHLAQKHPQIDFIFGGHDHLVVHEVVNNSILIKSGTNFKNFSMVKIFRKENFQNETQLQENNFVLKNSKWVAVVELAEVHHEKMNIVPDPQLHSYIDEIYSEFALAQERVVLYTRQDCDLTFKTIRKSQTPFIEFLSTLYVHSVKADCALVNSGNFRIDKLIPAGPITYNVLTNIIFDNVVVKELKGKRLIEALQNCVSMYPNLSGRFSGIAGVQFVWDCRKKPYERVVFETVKINGVPIDLERVYLVAMHKFMSMGGDGYIVCKESPLHQPQIEKTNMGIINGFLEKDEDLLKGYKQKHPNIINDIVVDGQHFMELNLEEKVHVRMIGE